MDGKEIIDLTASDGLEPSLQRESTRNYASTAQGEGNEAITVIDEDEVVEVIEVEENTETRKKPKRKKARRSGKKRKREAEDGEIVESETVEGSVQMSREDSGNEQDDVDASGSSSTPKTKKQKSKDIAKAGRSLIDRLSAVVERAVDDEDDEDEPEPDAEDNSTLPRPKSKHSRKTKMEKKRKRRERARERGQEDKERASAADSTLFFVDDEPPDHLVVAAAVVLPPPTFLAPLPAVATVSKGGTVKEEAKLLLPAHVSVLAIEGEGDVPAVEITAPVPVDSDDEDYIDYLDYDDDRKVSILTVCLVIELIGGKVGLVRYFDDVNEVAEAKAAKATRIVCKKCGAEGEHKTYDCPVLIVSHHALLCPILP